MRTLDLAPGTYRFVMRVDDGGQLYVDDRLLINAWRDQVATTYIAYTYHSGSPAAIEMDYYEHRGRARAQLFWEPVVAHPPPIRAEVVLDDGMSILRGWLHLAIILELFARRIVGSRQQACLILSADIQWGVTPGQGEEDQLSGRFVLPSSSVRKLLVGSAQDVSSHGSAFRARRGFSSLWNTGCQPMLPNDAALGFTKPVAPILQNSHVPTPRSRLSAVAWFGHPTAHWCQELAQVSGAHLAQDRLSGTLTPITIRILFASLTVSMVGNGVYLEPRKGGVHVLNS